MEESLFDAAGTRARKLGISRSELFVKAVEEFVRYRENEEITERLNASYADEEDERG
ncbi:MAG: hypothetical protein H0V28_02615 [Rubrobacteraceae bacterium]|nr:hypothetical protein [Rubrobacteraceae bacterium]MDQ3362151.1 hypothetical protein [Actinomycetota bacterium]MDQ3375400.1 hypothetical protein [Actinomycetota bacterium]